MQSSDLSEVVNRAEAMRQEGRIQEALETVEQFLEERPDHPRALLLRSRLLYELGDKAQAEEALHDLALIVGERELQPLAAALERLQHEEKSRRAPAFATESMAKLLAQQGYFLEALEVYRQLFQSASNTIELWDEIVRLKATVEEQGSRDATKERVGRELESWERWLRENRRGS